MRHDQRHTGNHPRRRSGLSTVSADRDPLEAGRADRREVPAHRHPDQRLPARGHPAHLRADAVQLSVAQPAHLAAPTGWTASPAASSRSSRPSRRPTTPTGIRAPRTPCGRRSRHFSQHRREYDLILAGDHLYRMDYADLVEAHNGSAPTSRSPPSRSTSRPRRRWASSASTRRQHRRLRGKAEDGAAGSKSDAASRRARPSATHSDEQPFMASMGVYVFSRRVLLEMLEHEAGHDFGRELIPNALGRYKVKPYLFRGYWADVGTIESFYDANVMLGRSASPFHFWDRERPIYTHLRHLPGSLMPDAASATRSSPTAAIWPGATSTDRSSASGRAYARARASHARCCSVPTSTSTVSRLTIARPGHRAQRRARPRDHRQERTHRRRRPPRQRTEGRVR